MKTVEQLIFEKRFKDAEFDPNDYNVSSVYVVQKANTKL